MEKQLIRLGTLKKHIIKDTHIYILKKYAKWWCLTCLLVRVHAVSQSVPLLQICMKIEAIIIIHA